MGRDTFACCRFLCMKYPPIATERRKMSEVATPHLMGLPSRAIHFPAGGRRQRGLSLDNPSCCPAVRLHLLPCRFLHPFLFTHAEPCRMPAEVFGPEFAILLGWVGERWKSSVPLVFWHTFGL